MNVPLATYRSKGCLPQQNDRQQEIQGNGVRFPFINSHTLEISRNILKHISRGSSPIHTLSFIHFLLDPVQVRSRELPAWNLTVLLSHEPPPLQQIQNLIHISALVQAQISANLARR